MYPMARGISHAIFAIQMAHPGLRKEVPIAGHARRILGMDQPVPPARRRWNLVQGDAQHAAARPSAKPC